MDQRVANNPRTDAYSDSSNEPKSVSVLGATGSIGDSTIDIIEQHPDLYKVVALTGGRNAQKLAEIAKKVRPEVVAIADDKQLHTLKEALLGIDCKVLGGKEGVLEAARVSCDMSISAIVGFAGLEPTLAALDAAKTLALANKESLVCAGGLVRHKASMLGVPILPMDSEHNAIFQSLHDEDISLVEQIILTASGGPFRTWSREKIAAAGPDKALKHPNWSMGAKITIDSATLMNKGLEVIEAFHLFPIKPEQLDVVVHPQSIIHGMVTFVDGAVIAELGCPDMRTPIAHCMAHPARVETKVERLNLAKVGELTFEEPDRERFPMLELARQAMIEGDVATNLLNGANEIAVECYLNKQLSFYQMSDLVAAVLETGIAEFTATRSIEDYETAANIDAFARKTGRETASKLSKS